MAGSPGAGKTEFSERYVQVSIERQFSVMKKDEEFVALLSERFNLDINDYEKLLISIDVDKVRNFLPQYQKTDVKKGIKGNAHVVNKAANRGLDILRNYCFENSISFLHDSTFGNQYSTLKDLIKRSLKSNRKIQIFYIYLDPLVAWEYTKEREFLEGRNIKKESFVEQFFKSMDNIDRAKKDFGNDVILNCILKETGKNVKKTKFNEQSVANFLKVEYNKGSIKEYTEETLGKLIN
jgi:hypothetical protein